MMPKYLSKIGTLKSPDLSTRAGLRNRQYDAAGDGVAGPRNAASNLTEGKPKLFVDTKILKHACLQTANCLPSKEIDQLMP